MMSETQIRSVALFFFCSIMEESVATSAIHKSLRRIEKELQKKDQIRPTHAVIVFWTDRIWRRYNKKVKYVTLGLDQMFRLPKDVDLDSWKQLQKEILPEEFLAAIWTGLLGYTANEVAEGLGVSQGMVQHRTGIALKRLGQIVTSGKLNAKKRA